MSDQDNYDVTVRVHPKQVHRSVQNIINNEMNLNRQALLDQAMQKMDSEIQSITDQLRKRTESSINAIFAGQLARWVEKIVDQEIKTIVSEKLKYLIETEFEKRIDEAIEVVIAKGIEFKVGWKKHRVKIVAREPEKPLKS